MSTAPSGSADRARAARLLVEVLQDGKTLDQTFGLGASSPLLQELVYGTLRYFLIRDERVDEELARRMKTRDLDLRCLMVVGAYQLHYTRIPDHAAINETVAACRGLKKPWARPLVNAVLRKVAGKQPNERSFGLPDWIAQAFDTHYPAHADRLKAATLERAPMSVRVNVLKVAPDAYRRALAEQRIGAAPGWFPEHLILDRPVPVRQLPGHAEGLVSVQDAGALFAAGLVSGKTPPARILEACAAPGGKLFHLIERMPDAAVTGLELSEPRLRHLENEAVRLGHQEVTLVHGDAATRDWAAAASFDAILLDAPCSGSGTLRRHPDIKLLRHPSDLAGYAERQLAMLDNLFELLAPGGALVYCTCSLFPEENDDVIAAFLDHQPRAVLTPLELEVGIATRHGWQLLPLPAAGDPPNRTVDGFYFARMTRREKAR
ncbi:MAG: 16S rRNA (cytosine(967)-C(5))-methyltransferase RsmB [Gammaproteobacteria bacterium]